MLVLNKRHDLVLHSDRTLFFAKKRKTKRKNEKNALFHVSRVTVKLIFVNLLVG
jgi:hypothetical protein